MRSRPVGRPPRAKSSADNRVTIRFTDDELAAYTKLAGCDSLSEWIRRTLAKAVARGKR